MCLFVFVFVTNLVGADRNPDVHAHRPLPSEQYEQYVRRAQVPHAGSYL